MRTKTLCIVAIAVLVVASAAAAAVMLFGRSSAKSGSTKANSEDASSNIVTFAPTITPSPRQPLPTLAGTLEPSALLVSPVSSEATGTPVDDLATTLNPIVPSSQPVAPIATTPLPVQTTPGPTITTPGPTTTTPPQAILPTSEPFVIVACVALNDECNPQSGAGRCCDGRLCVQLRDQHRCRGEVNAVSN